MTYSDILPLNAFSVGITEVQYLLELRVVRCYGVVGKRFGRKGQTVRCI